MKRMIRHIIEPERLFLAWQAPDGTSHDRTRRKVAEITPDDSGIVILRYLKDSEDFVKACLAGFTGYPAFPLGQDQYASGVLETFMRRLPPMKRRDYHDFMRLWRLDPAISISSLAMLGYVGAQLPGDGFSLVHPFDNGKPPFELLEEVAGFRYRENFGRILALLHEGQEIQLRAEPDNPHDPKAIRVELPDNRLIGYINKLQAPGLHKWLPNQNVRCTVDRINGTETRPLVYVFLEVGGTP
ncbi:MAG: HIRAN domain-containing protein [Magnetococcus sp. DMHC-1]